MWRRWLPAELELLNQLAGDVPWPKAVQVFQREARLRGWPERTENAMGCQAKKLGFSCRADAGTWTTTYGAGRLLGCDPRRIDAWFDEPSLVAILEPKQLKPGGARFICRAAWRRLARERPDVLGGLTADGLFLLLEDRELADAVASRYRLRRNDYRVRCIETGRVYASCDAVAQSHHVSRSAVSLAIRRGRQVTSIGLSFEALRKPRVLPTLER